VVVFDRRAAVELRTFALSSSELDSAELLDVLYTPAPLPPVLGSWLV
jgi:hypothetical protein